MPIQFPTFPWPTFQQSNPMLTGASAGIGLMGQGQEDLYKQMLTNQLTSKYGEKQIQADLLTKELENQKNQQLMQYLQPTAQAKLDLIKSQIERQKQLANQPFGGMKLTGPAQQALSLELVKSNFGENSPMYTNAKKLFDATLKRIDMYGAGVGGQQLSRLQQQIQLDNPTLQPNQINEATNAYLEGKRELSDGTKLPEPGGQTRTLLDEIEVKRRGMKNITQQVRANTLDSIIDEADQYAPGAFAYSGLIGRTGLAAEQAKASFQQENPKEYSDYIKFTRQLVPTMMGEMLLTLGGNSTDNQKALMAQIANPIAWDVSPQVALQTWQYLKHLFRDVISPSITLSPSQIKERINSRQNKEFEKILLKDLKVNNLNLQNKNDQQIDDIANRPLSHE